MPLSYVNVCLGPFGQRILAEVFTVIQLKGIAAMTDLWLRDSGYRGTNKNPHFPAKTQKLVTNPN